MATKKAEAMKKVEQAAVHTLRLRSMTALTVVCLDLQHWMPMKVRMHIPKTKK